MKLRNLGYRVVYQLVQDGRIRRVIVISVRDDDMVYREAERRIRGLGNTNEVIFRQGTGTGDMGHGSVN